MTKKKPKTKQQGEKVKLPKKKKPKFPRTGEGAEYMKRIRKKKKED